MAIDSTNSSAGERSFALPALPLFSPKASVSIDDEVRRATGLSSSKGLHPPGQREFFRQEDALKHIQSLVDSGQYDASDVGLFAREINNTGGRKFIVDTHAGFALRRCPSHKVDMQADHYYEIIREAQPCWLYFDLEFSRVANPSRDIQKVAAAFYDMFDEFCGEVLEAKLVIDSVVELDSTTPEKFSKHVIIKQLRQLPSHGAQDTGKVVALAFSNNAQAGLVVTEFVAYLRRKFEEATGKPSVVNELFFEVQGDKERNASLIDECVYSRNRCFRLVFSSKFGKAKTLRYAKGPDLESQDFLQLANSMASCVPRSTCIFAHPLIPIGHSHGNAPTRRISRRASLPITSIQVHRHTQQESPSGLHEYLIKHWDGVRSEMDPEGPNVSQRPTRVQSSVVVGEIPYVYLSLTLSHNRFCFCKGSCHKSNSIYIVINPRRCVFYQKCHDIDCRDFRSEKIPIPKELLTEYSEIPSEIIGASLEDVDYESGAAPQDGTKNLRDESDTESEIEAEANAIFATQPEVNAIFVSQADTEFETEADTECDTEADDLESVTEAEGTQVVESREQQEKRRMDEICDKLLVDIEDSQVPQNASHHKVSTCERRNEIMKAKESGTVDYCDKLLADSEDSQEIDDTTTHIYGTPPKKAKVSTRMHLERLCSSLWENSQDNDTSQLI